MKKTIAWMVMIVVLFSYSSAAFTAYAEQAATVSLSTTNTKFNAGDTFVVTVNAQNIRPFYACETLIEFDSAKLQLVGSPVSYLKGSTAYKTRDNSIQFGYTQVGRASMQNGGNLKICALTFKVKSAGEAAIKLNWLRCYDDNLLESNYYGNGSISISSKGNIEKNVIPAVATLNASGEADVPVDAHSIEQAFAQSKNIIVNVSSVSGASAYVLNFPAQTFSAMDGGRTITIRTDFAEMTLPVNMLSSIGRSGVSEFKFRISKVNNNSSGGDIQSPIGGKPVMDLSPTNQRTAA